METLNRSSGILLHPTSLPGPYGIGDIGSNAYLWIDSLAKSCQSWWQILPITPTGYGDSPYQALSAFAGNPNLISPEEMAKIGLLRWSDLESPDFPADHVDFDSGDVIRFKWSLMMKAWRNYQNGWASMLTPLFENFCEQEKRWLDDYALYMAVKNVHGGRSWLDWDEDIRLRKPEAIARASSRLEDEIELHKFLQFVFQNQWQALKKYANSRGVRLIGDVPIFVSADSADVWANSRYFQLNEQRRPAVVAGVPPDYFSKTGQLWGNPLYDWDALKQDGYDWWVRRLQRIFQQVDAARIDHFRGFEAYWEVPGGAETAIDGRWVKGPAYDLFDTLALKLGDVPIIAEDLGVITAQVDELRMHYNFPGMRILQFAFSGAVEERFLPHNFDTNLVVYTGTHDNNTTVGWYSGMTEEEKEYLSKYLGWEVLEVSWALIRMAWSSVANLAITPLQDVLSLGTKARMNLPGKAAGYWRWRYRKEMLTEDHLGRLRDLTELFYRDRKNLL